MFELLKKEFIEYQENRKSEWSFNIENGFCKTWNERERATENKDRFLRSESTDTRWEQYTSGKITREQAVSYATARKHKAIDKETAAGLKRLEQVAAAGMPDYIRTVVWWTRNYSARCESFGGRDVTTGHAGGYGYDKESACVADAWNKNPAMLNILYTLKENGLAAGKSDKSKTACTGRDNRDIIGYGSGYSVLPYYEGGVGFTCFEHILKKAGYTMDGTYGKTEHHYVFHRGGENVDD